MAMQFWWLNRRLDWLEWQIRLRSFLPRQQAYRELSPNQEGGDYAVPSVWWLHGARLLVRPSR